jgi:hypothetical protein
MNKEFLHMQKLAGIITEGEYNAKMNEDFKVEKPQDFINYEDAEEGEGTPIETYKFLTYFYNLLEKGGYDIPKDLQDWMDEAQYDFAAFEENEDSEDGYYPLSYWENFNLQDAKEQVNKFLDSFNDENGTDYSSVEDFKTR